MECLLWVFWVKNDQIKMETHCMYCTNSPFWLTLDALLIWRDGGTLDANAVFADGLGRVNCHLIVGGITVGQPQIVVKALHIQIGEDQLQRETGLFKDHTNNIYIHLCILKIKCLKIRFSLPHQYPLQKKKWFVSKFNTNLWETGPFSFLFQ